jgi:hypothetical protein
MPVTVRTVQYGFKSGRSAPGSDLRPRAASLAGAPAGADASDQGPRTPGCGRDWCGLPTNDPCRPTAVTHCFD